MFEKDTKWLAYHLTLETADLHDVNCTTIGADMIINVDKKKSVFTLPLSSCRNTANV